MTHINDGGKYIGPKHHRKHLCQQGAEVVLIKMYQEGTGCTPDESQTILILIKMFLPGILQHRKIRIKKVGDISRSRVSRLRLDLSSSELGIFC